MSKRLCIIAILFAGSNFCHAQLLKVNGKAIVDDKGDTIILRGMGLGGWMLQEGYMLRLSNLGQQYRIREKINEAVGPEKTALFYDQWLLHHTTKRDIDSLAAWGFNSIRLPMHFNLYTLPVAKEPVPGQHTWIEKGFSMTDSLLSWCKDNRLYLILDLHAAPGGQGNDLAIADRDPATPSLWDSRENQDKTIALWTKLADRYKHEAWIGGYDIINEPNWGFEDPKGDPRGTAENKNVPLRKLMMEITDAIRSVDKQHIIFIEGNGFGNNYRGVLPPWDNNTVLSFHKYGNFNTLTSIKTFLDLREQYNMPIWLGESGENSNTWFTEAIHLAESNGIGWAWWQLKKMGINNPLEIKRPEGYDELLSWWAGKGSRPEPEKAWNTLLQLLENIKIANTILQRDVVHAMITQVKSDETDPFIPVIINYKATIPAVNYDLGKQRFAYYDTDSSRYQYTPGVNTDGNRGHFYRNDGVDIQQGNSGPYIFKIEDGEWLQYTVQVAQAGTYTISFFTSSEKTKSEISLLLNNNVLIRQILPVTGSEDSWKETTSSPVRLPQGRYSFRILAVKGGFNFDRIQFDKIQ